VTFPEVGDESLFMLIFTSGTSGEPKAVRVTHEKVWFPGVVLADMFSLTGEDVLYVSMPLFHSNAVMSGYAPALVAGATLALAERFSASGFLGDVRHFGATYMNYVGKPLSYILATPEREDDSDNPLRIAFGNEANEKDIAAFSTRFGCEVRDGFGSTENAVIISRVEGTPPGSLGKPLDGVKVLDRDTGQECPPAKFGPDGKVLNLEECVGELVNTLGAGQFAGYYNDEAATVERMRDGMYWSGDLGYLDADGYLFIVDRMKDLIKTHGYQVWPREIEEVLAAHPAVAEVGVAGVPDEAKGEVARAWVVLAEGRQATAEELRAFCRERLAPYKVPATVEFRDELPKTMVGKVLRRALTEPGSAP
jgi:fatty-acyl-CoA synthase